MIVEDDLDQQDLLIQWLNDYGNFEVLAVARDVPSGIKALSQSHPDLVILDVLLPPGNCFELLEALEHFTFKIIFTTAFDGYAIRAFRLAAVDYLLKPLDRTEFFLAIRRFESLIEVKDHLSRVHMVLASIRGNAAGGERAALPTLKGFISVPIRDIVRCESDNTYTSVFTVDKRRLVISRTLKECERQLQEFNFCRVHNSHLVNLIHVVEYQRGEGGVIRMIDGSTIDVSRRRKDEFLRRFNML